MNCVPLNHIYIYYISWNASEESFRIVTFSCRNWWTGIALWIEFKTSDYAIHDCCMTSTRIWIDFQLDRSDYSTAVLPIYSVTYTNNVKPNFDLAERNNFIHMKDLTWFNEHLPKNTFQPYFLHKIVLTASKTCKPFTVSHVIWSVILSHCKIVNSKFRPKQMIMVSCIATNVYDVISNVFEYKWPDNEIKAATVCVFVCV